jgi:phage portal protein BeeE
VRRHVLAPERRSLTSGLANPAGWLTDSLGAFTAPSGKRVTVEKALGLSPVWSAVSIIAEQVGQLPLKVYRELRRPGRRVSASRRGQHRSWRLLHDKPNASTPADRFWSAVTAQLLLYGNAFIRKDRTDPFGDVDELHLLEPETVTITYNPDTAASSSSTSRATPARSADYGEDRVLHIFSCRSTASPACRSSVLQGGARRGDGPRRVRGRLLRSRRDAVRRSPAPGQLSDTAANLKESFSTLYGGSGKAHGTPVLEEGAEFVKVGSPLGDLQFVESQNLSRTDIAVMFKLPPNYLGGSSGDSLTYSTVESNSTHFAMHAIAPVTNTIAKALSNDPELLPQQVFEAEFELKALMRGTMADRVAYYKAMKDMGAMTDDEIRREENMPALTDAQKEALAPPPPPQPQ